MSRLWTQVGVDKILESVDVKLLKITMDNELKFGKRVMKIFSKANTILSVLGRMSKIFTLEKKMNIFETIVESLFKYCPITYMFHNHYINNITNRSIALKLVCNWLWINFWTNNTLRWLDLEGGLILLSSTERISKHRHFSNLGIT